MNWHYNKEQERILFWRFPLTKGSSSCSYLC